MKIFIGDYELEKDRNGYILTIYGISNKGINEWSRVQKDQVYPSSLIAAIQYIRQKKLDRELNVSLWEALEEIERIDKQFITELTEAFRGINMDEFLDTKTK